MLVIIEGPDGSGKTTLANYLRKNVEAYAWLLRSNGPPTNVIDMLRTVRWITRDAPPHLNVICDRFPIISEIVYGPILRDRCLHDYTPKLIAQYFLTAPYPTIIIHCRPPLQELELSVHSQVQMTGVKNNLSRIAETYDVLMQDLHREGVQIYRYDYTESPLPIVQTVQEFFGGEKHG